MAALKLYVMCEGGFGVGPSLARQGALGVHYLPGRKPAAGLIGLSGFLVDAHGPCSAREAMAAGSNRGVLPNPESNSL